MLDRSVGAGEDESWADVRKSGPQMWQPNRISLGVPDDQYTPVQH